MQAPIGVESAGRVISTLQALPIGAHGLAAAGLVAGLVLWLAGRRVIKPIFGVLGAVNGGAVGFFVAPLVATGEWGGVPVPYWGMGIGAALGVVVAVVLFRVAMAVSTGVVLALAASLGAWVYLHFADAVAPAPVQEAASAPTAPLTPDQQAIEDLRSRAQGVVQHARESFVAAVDPQGDRTPSERTKDFLHALGDKLAGMWGELPVKHRVVIGGSVLAGAAAGFLAGLFMPIWCSVIVTALLGAAVWLPCLAWLMHAVNAPGQEAFRHGPLAWLGVWMGVGLVGLVAQASGLGRGRRAPAGEAAGE